MLVKNIDASKRHCFGVTPYIVLPKQKSYSSSPEMSLQGITKYYLNI